jgi:hypothetical protein
MLKLSKYQLRTEVAFLTDRAPVMQHLNTLGQSDSNLDRRFGNMDTETVYHIRSAALQFIC